MSEGLVRNRRRHAELGQQRSNLRLGVGVVAVLLECYGVLDNFTY
jgi:hypothetical protein